MATPGMMVIASATLVAGNLPTSSAVIKLTMASALRLVSNDCCRLARMPVTTTLSSSVASPAAAGAGAASCACAVMLKHITIAADSAVLRWLMLSLPSCFFWSARLAGGACGCLTPTAGNSPLFAEDAIRVGWPREASATSRGPCPTRVAAMRWSDSRRGVPRAGGGQPMAMAGWAEPPMVGIRSARTWKPVAAVPGNMACSGSRDSALGAGLMAATRLPTCPADGSPLRLLSRPSVGEC